MEHSVVVHYLQPSEVLGSACEFTKELVHIKGSWDIQSCGLTSTLMNHPID